MVANLLGGSPLPLMAERQGRSVRAILIRLGALLSRDAHHPDFIPVDRSRLDGGLAKKAIDMYTQQQEMGSSMGSTGVGAGGRGPPAASGAVSTTPMRSEDIQKILDAVGELRSEVRKLRAQIRHYHNKSN